MYRPPHKTSIVSRKRESGQRLAGYVDNSEATSPRRLVLFNPGSYRVALWHRHGLTSKTCLSRQRATTPLAKPLRLYAKRMIEPRPIIFPCKRRGQFHKLCFREPLAKLLKQRLRNLHGSLRHGIGILEHKLLRLRKQRAASVVGQCFDLLSRYAALSADRRTDVNSKWAPNQDGHAQLRQVFQTSVNQPARAKRQLHLRMAPKNPAVMRDDLHRHHHASHLALRQCIRDVR